MTVGDPRPSRRITDSTAGIEKVRDEGACRACGLKGLPNLTRHHLVGRGQRGDDVDVNIVPLCGSGTTGCHGSLTDHHRASAPSLLAGMPYEAIVSALRSKLTAAEKDYIVKKKSEGWLNEHYSW